MLRTLIVEDNISFRKVFGSELLSEFPSMEVIEAGSGEEALKGLGSHPVDLVFMDIKLPGQSGLQVTERIKADHPDTTINILTSFNLPEYREAAIRSGASGFIVKGDFKLEQIFTLIRCFQKAKLNGRKPNCSRFAGGSE
jgi:DNA-binding NarL/FixJ family response regulator